MSAFTDFEPMFRETYTLILNSLEKNQIYFMDDDPALSRLSFFKLIVYVLAALSHTGGVLDRVNQGADLVQLSSDISSALVLWQTILLYVQLYANRKLIRNVIINLGQRWRADDRLRPEIVNVKHKSMKSFYTWISVFYKMITSFTLIYLSPRLLYVTVKHLILKQEVAFTFPFQVKVPFPVEDNFVLYCLVYLADCKILIDVSYLLTFDLVLMNATMHHLRLMFVILQDDINGIRDTDQATAELSLRKLIPDHADLLKSMLEISKAFGSTFLIHLIFFSGTMCFFGFAARVHFSPENLQNMLPCSLILICIYTCCSYGQHLTDASASISDAAYNGRWYHMSEQYKRSVIFIMLRSQKAQYIKSTSFTDVSLETFTKILNATWSFLSLITNMYEA